MNKFETILFCLKTKIIKIKLEILRILLIFFSKHIYLLRVVHYIYYSIIMFLVLSMIIGVFYITILNLYIKNQMILEMIDVFHLPTFFHNFKFINAALLLTYGLIKIYEKTTKLDVFPNLTYLKYYLVTITFSLGASLFISLDTNDGDLSQIIFTLFISIFPYRILKEIFSEEILKTPTDTIKNWKDSIEKNKVRDSS